MPLVRVMATLFMKLGMDSSAMARPAATAPSLTAAACASTSSIVILPKSAPPRLMLRMKYDLLTAALTAASASLSISFLTYPPLEARAG